MTERLYYLDAALLDFDATVVDAGVRGGRAYAVLDRTAFYPASGGQPHDTGTLADARVDEVVDRGDGTIDHWLDRELDRGATVRGIVDAARRFDHMQQHTGQHVLSAAFDRLFGWRTESFHLGSEMSTIDLAAAPGALEIDRAETEANRVVWEDRPVTVRFVDEAEAAALRLRKEPARDGVLRIVEVTDFDRSACGGTHVARTGAIGVIAITGWERFKGGVRIEFVCGGRALRRFRHLRDAVAGSIRQLSVLPGELPDAIRRLQDDLRATRHEQRELTERLAAFEADTLVAGATVVNGVSVVAAVVPGRDGAGLKALAQATTARPGRAVLLVADTRPALTVVARSRDVTLDAAGVLRALLGAYGGKGGGRPDLAQGGGLDADPEAICAAGAALLSGGVTSRATTG